MGELSRAHMNLCNPGKGCRWLIPNKEPSRQDLGEDLGINIYGCKLNYGNLSTIYASVQRLQRRKTEQNLSARYALRKCLLKAQVPKVGPHPAHGPLEPLAHVT